MTEHAVPDCNESGSAAGAAHERRRRRSDDPVTALHYQLAHARSIAGLEAVVLVDDAGCLVAGAGAWPVCEELAAFAPLFVTPDAVTSGSRASASVGGRLAALETEVSVQRISLDGMEALLCVRGARASEAGLMTRAADGCRRILVG